MYPIKCECGVENRRSEVEKHKIEECPLGEVECIIEGCTEKVLRKNMSEHLEKNSSVHLQLTMNQIIQLKKENNQLRDQVKSFFDQRAQAVNSSSFVCKVEDKKFTPDDRLTHKFISHGLKFEIWIYPNKEQEAVGIFLSIDEDIRPITKWYFSILGLGGEPITLSFLKDFKDVERTGGWGYPCAIGKEDNPWFSRKVKEFTIITTIWFAIADKPNKESNSA